MAGQTTEQVVYDGIINAFNSTAKGDGVNNLGKDVQDYIDRTLLKEAEKNLVMAKYAKELDIPKNNGKTIKTYKYQSLEKALTPLVEGVPPKGSKLRREPVVIVAESYGDYVPVTDEATEVDLFNNATEAIELCGKQAGETVDTLIRKQIVKGTNVYYAGGTSRATVNGNITGALIKQAATVLKNANVPTINGYYVAFVNPNVEYDLTNDPLWEKVNISNKGGKNIFEGEIGELHGVKFIRTTETEIYEKASQNNRNVHVTLIFGADAFAVTSIGGQKANKPKTIIKPLGSAGTADPLNQQGSVGWKTRLGAGILQQERLVRLETETTLD